MMLFLVIIGLMAGIALASYLYERRNGTARRSQGNDPGNGWDDSCGDAQTFHSGSEDCSDFDAGADAD